MERIADVFSRAAGASVLILTPFLASGAAFYAGWEAAGWLFDDHGFLTANSASAALVKATFSGLGLALAGPLSVLVGSPPLADRAANVAAKCVQRAFGIN